MYSWSYGRRSGAKSKQPENFSNSHLRRPKKRGCALAGNRTRINCLEGNYADHYTTNALLSRKNAITVKDIKGEVRTINDRNICERRNCMKNNGKSPTFKFVSGEERRSSEVQRVSRGWRLPGATHSSADLTWIRRRLKIQAPELSELESVELELESCCSDLEKQVLDEIRRTRNRQFEIPFRL